MRIDWITLIKTAVTESTFQEVTPVSSVSCWAKQKSVVRSEFYAADANGRQVDAVFEASPIDYDGHQQLIHHTAGSTALTLSPKGNIEPFEADNRDYAMIDKSEGYDGELETAYIPAAIAAAILAITEDTKKVAEEYSGRVYPQFALLAQFQGDAHNRRIALYDCVITARPEIASKTGKTKTREFGEVSGTLYAGAGGGGGQIGSGGAGGAGGGGAGGSAPYSGTASAGVAGTNNYGGGGGGGGSSTTSGAAGAAGGSGICIIRNYR